MFKGKSVTGRQDFDIFFAVFSLIFTNYNYFVRKLELKL